MSKLKLAIIGATGSALKRTIPALQNSETVIVSAVQSRNQQKLDELRDRFGIQNCFIDVDDLLRSEKFDFIYIATPPFLHRDDLEKAISTGKPIICEKPLAQNLQEAEAIKTLLEGYSSPFMVAHHLRHQQAIVDIKNSIQASSIGNPTACWCQWSFQLNPSAPNARWKLDPNMGGQGPFFDAGIHAIDLMLYLFGPPKSVMGHSFKMRSGDNFDNATALLCYDKLTVAVNASQNTPAIGNHLLIYGTNGKIEALGAMGEKSIMEVTYRSGEHEDIRKYDQVNMYGLEVEHFARVLMGQSHSHDGTSLAEAVLAIRILAAIQHAFSSSHSGV